MAYNSESGYGKALVNMVSSIIPTFGRIFVVVSSSDAGEERYDRLMEVIKTDPNGQIRLFTLYLMLIALLHQITMMLFYLMETQPTL